MISGELMVVEVMQRGVVLVPDVEHGSRGVGKVGLSGIAALDSDGRLRKQDRASKEVVFMGTARMCDN
jgi:hypothetical protein